MANVVLDLERLRTRYCGLGQFCFHLGGAIAKVDDPDIRPTFLVPSRPTPDFVASAGLTMAATWWRQESILRWMRPAAAAVARRRIDLWHSTHQDSDYLPLHPSVPLVLTIHDLNFLREKSAKTARRRLRRLQRKVDRAAAVTTGSHFAADEIRSHLSLQGKDLVAISHGVCTQMPPVGACRPAFLGDGPFLFSLGDVTPKKNFHTLVELMVRLPELRLVLAGKKSAPYAQRIKKMVADAGIGERFLLPGIVTEVEAAWLYHHCEAFLFPSLSEGFGLPLLEAMSCGKPVFSSDRTSLPEVGGSLAFYWEDFDPDAMARVFRQGMRAVQDDSEHALKLRRHAAQFRWEDAALQYLAVYRALLK